jgi:hypothetical protein
VYGIRAKTDVSKRLNLTLPDTVYEELEDWAQQQGRPTANLGSFLIELAKEKSEFVPTKKNPATKSKRVRNDSDDSTGE